MIISASQAQPGPGLRGASLGITLALIAVVIGGLGVASLFGGVLGLDESPVSRRYLLVPALLLLGSVALVVLQLSGPGTIGLVMAVAVAGRLFPGRPSSILFAACTAFVVIAEIVGASIRHTDKSGAPNLIGVLALAAVYGLGLSARRNREQEQQAERLLIELEATRGAELRAATLAERQRLAREIHDVLAHSLSGLVVQLEGARLLAQFDPADGRLGGVIDRSHQLAKSGLDEARRAIGMLRGDELPNPARLAEAFTADTGIPCQFAITGQPRDLSSAMRLALYRVTQEALTNARKHAHPERVEVRLDYQPGAVGLSVEDFAVAPPDPPGEDPADLDAGMADGGYGLTGMRERAKLLGGTLTAAPTGGGFLVQLKIPA